VARERSEPLSGVDQLPRSSAGAPERMQSDHLRVGDHNVDSYEKVPGTASCLGA
jgi:hypothetical protein